MERSSGKKGDTKERILEIALDLFSVHGYQAVSIRDICGQLGFTESSIYYHYKNKQAIMDALQEKIMQLAEQMMETFQGQFEIAQKVSADEICMVAVGELKGYFLNPYVHKMISVLNLERMSDEKAHVIYQKIVFDMPLLQHEQVFKAMQAKGMIQEFDAALLARRYYAIIFLAFQKNCITREISQEQIDRASSEICSDVRAFYETITR